MTFYKSVIGITPSYRNGIMSVNRLYCSCVEFAGGIPFVLPVTYDKEALLDICTVCDGIIFSGGGDIDPAYYGEKKDPGCGVIDIDRDRYEFLLTEHFLANNIPFLGICRGIQLMNVMLGGSLEQHVIGHSDTSHKIKTVKGSFLNGLIKEKNLTVNSYHHQSVKRLGEGLTVSSYSEDGQIESIELKGHSYGIGVQWHPERMTAVDGAGFELANKLFSSFVQATKAKK